MEWYLKDDTIYASNSKEKNFEVGFFLPTASEQERLMIVKCDELYDATGEFLMKYDESKTVLKSLFEIFESIVDKKTNYNFTWEKTLEGELLNENGNVIFIFAVKYTSIYARNIMHVPKIYNIIQVLLNRLSSSNSRNLKQIYKEVNNVYAKIIDGY